MSTSSPTQNLLSRGPTFHTNVHGERRFHNRDGSTAECGQVRLDGVVRDSEVGRRLAGLVEHSRPAIVDTESGRA